MLVINYYTPHGASTCHTFYVTEIYGQVKTFCWIVNSFTRLLNSPIHLTENYHE